MKAKYLGIVLLAGAVLAGCGGGSSSTSGPAPLATVQIDSTNSSKVANGAISAASLKINSLSPLGVETTNSTANNDRIIQNVADFAMQKFAEQQNASLSVAGVVTGSTNCNGVDATGGTISFVSDGTGPSNSTYVTFTFTNCKIGTTTTINGTFGITGLSATTSNLTATVSINLTVTTTGQATVKMVGGYTLTETGIATTARVNTLSGSSLVYSVDSLNEALTNFSFSSSYNDITRSTYSDTVNYTISSDFTGGSFRLATTAGMPIVHNSTDIYPRSGQVVIYGASSSALRVTVVSTDPNAGISSSATVKLELSTDGGVTFPTSTIKTWANLAAGV